MSQPRIIVRQIGITAARHGVARLHRHLQPPPSGLVAFEALVGGWPVGWAIVGRPGSRVLQARGWVEVTRVATDGTDNACSALYGAAARWALPQLRPILTYTLPHEGGASLRGAGWVPCGLTDGGRWSCPSRFRHPGAVEGLRKQRWVPRGVVYPFGVGPADGPWLIAALEAA